MAQKDVKVASESSPATVIKFPSSPSNPSNFRPVKNGCSLEAAGPARISVIGPNGRSTDGRKDGTPNSESTEWARVEEANQGIGKLSIKELKALWPVLHERTYHTWENVKKRGKEHGIADEFKAFPSFLMLVKFKPYPSASLDRIDPTKGYYVDNVRWANKKTQAENKLKPPQSQSVFPIGKAEAWEKAYSRGRLQHDTRQFFMLRTARQQMKKLISDIKLAGSVMENFDGDLVPCLRLTPGNEGALRPLVNRLAYFYEAWRQAEHLILTRPPECYRLLEPEHRNTDRLIGVVGTLLRLRCKNGPQFVDPIKLPYLNEWAKQLLSALHGNLINRVEEVLGLLWALVDEKTLPAFSDTPRFDLWTYPRDVPTVRHEHLNS